jgi:hypothetical protein
MKELRQFYDKILNSPKKFKLLWSLETKRSQWVKSTDDVIKSLQVEQKDLFFGIGMTDKAYGPKRRGTLSQITSICCVYLDIDIVSDNEDVHSKNNLPKTIDEAIEIANKFLEPTYIVHSGHGIHAYYCFEEPVDLKKNGKLFADLLRQFQMAHRKAFPQYQLDYTHDVTRVLRCPGTINNKNPKNPVECKIIHSTGPDYWLAEIEDAIEFNPDLTFETDLPFDNKKSYNKNPESALALKSTQEFIQWFDEQGLVVDPNASIDAETWVELEQMSNGRLSELYNHKKMKHVDISSIDMSLANLGARNCLTDQQIVDLMIMHRRKYNVKPYKMLRKDYYARTLIHAIADRLLENIRQKKITLKQEAVSRTPELKDSETNTVVIPTRRTIFDQYAPSEKQTIRDHLKALLGVEIKRIVCYPKDPEPVFELELADMPGRPVELGTYQKGIMSQTSFRASIASVGLPVPNKVAKNVWDPTVLKDLRILTEEGNIPETATYDGQIKIFLREYFDTKTIEIKQGKPSEEYPLASTCGTYIYFNLDQFRRWLLATKGVAITFNLENTMMQSGFKQAGSIYTTPPNFYTIPKTETDPEEEREDD